MRVISKAQRAGILERLKHNKKYLAVVLCTGKRVEKEALEFVSVLQEAGWTVSGPDTDATVAAEGLQIGVRDLYSPCPSARLLLDVLVSVGLNASLVKAAWFLPSGLPGEPPGRPLWEAPHR